MAIVFDFTPRGSIVIQVAVYYPQLAEDPLIQARNFRIGGNTMETNLTRQRQHAHELIDKMSVRQVVAAVGLFEAMLDPVEIASANALHDDEPLTAEEIKALDESNEWLRHNDPIPHEQVLAELGITQEEIDNYRAPQYAEPQ
ncbi:hypothetical protein [Granulicella aggregans]|uniref:hypothetical protein n=1 Tax=Granulicella aggregans TaxID=474949 RepID=UPI0021DF917A|nr:hypothetical protein [Granulicella aggregans]